MPKPTTEQPKPEKPKDSQPSILKFSDKKPKTESKKGSNGKGSAAEKSSAPKEPIKDSKESGSETKKTPKPKKAEPRKILYENIVVKKFIGSEALTAEGAKKLLGWQEESENVKFGPDYLLTDLDGKKVRCHNNASNRPFDKAWCDTLRAEHLRRKWKLNGETMIIGKTGLTIAAQHRLAALVLAAQEWVKKPDTWKPYWKTEPTMECLIVFGIEEDDETVNTIDTGKPRSLTDVIFRSEIFAKYKAGERAKLAKRLASAIKLLWDRTGAKENAYAPQRTHAESLDFLARHPKLLDAVKHIYEEDSEGKISKYLSPGYAAGLLYLQGSCLSLWESEGGKGTAYGEVSNPTEELLDWEMWDKACEFWVLIASEHKDFAALRAALGSILDEAGNATHAEKLALLVKLWNRWSNGDPTEAEDLALAYEVDGEGVRRLNEIPTVGGIDIGVPV